MGQVIDTETAKEFMKETLEKVDSEELARISKEVEEKAAWFGRTLDATALPALTDDAFFTILRSVFAIGRKAKKVQAAWPLERFRSDASRLLYGADAPATRFETFVDDTAPYFEGFELNARRDFASEVLHFTAPDRYWLWTRWMWDPRTSTGALPLVTTAAYDLQGERSSDVYLKVGRAIAFVHEVGDATGFRSTDRSIFGTDVFLSCVYTIYVYTVLKMRMTQEFNKVMPQLPEFSRRLLGVHQKPYAVSPVNQ